jgi:hypothetical protein
MQLIRLAPNGASNGTCRPISRIGGMSRSCVHLEQFPGRAGRIVRDAEEEMIGHSIASALAGGS